MSWLGELVVNAMLNAVSCVRVTEQWSSVSWSMVLKPFVWANAMRECVVLAACVFALLVSRLLLERLRTIKGCRLMSGRRSFRSVSLSLIPEMSVLLCRTTEWIFRGTSS